jgi:tetratricopeptide (TPR) repeat protein
VAKGGRAADLQKAMAAFRGGRLDEADRIYRDVLGKDPRSFEAAYALGSLCLRRGRVAEGERILGQAAAIDPSSAAAHHDRALALRALGRSAEALVCYDRAIALAPEHPAFYSNRAVALVDLGRLEEAVASFDAAITRDPRDAAARYLRGNALLRAGRIEAALSDFDAAIALNPGLAEAHNNRGNALREGNRLSEALSSYDRAAALAPNNPVFAYNRGFALHDCGRLDDAMAAYNRAVALRPDFAEARKARGSLKLLLGRMPEGFADFEWRLRSDEQRLDPRLRAIRYWTGEDVDGKSILVYGDGAFGDLVQFARYLPLLAARGASVSLLLPPQFRRVLSGEALNARIVSELPVADLRCELLSLPALFKTDIASIPPVVDAITQDADRAATWAATLDRDRFNVGICWQGNPERNIDKGRSIPLREFAPLAALANVDLVSLQKRHGLDQLVDLPAVRQLGADFDEGADAFLDTAAAMRSLDLIVTSDTAVAHLAATLGRPTWLALRHVPEWRWLLERGDSPWYPSVRLFRQPRLDSWKPVFEEIAAVLAPLSARR